MAVSRTAGLGIAGLALFVLGHELVRRLAFESWNVARQIYAVRYVGLLALVIAAAIAALKPGTGTGGVARRTVMVCVVALVAGCAIWFIRSPANWHGEYAPWIEWSTVVFAAALLPSLFGS